MNIDNIRYTFKVNDRDEFDHLESDLEKFLEAYKITSNTNGFDVCYSRSFLCITPGIVCASNAIEINRRDEQTGLIGYLKYADQARVEILLFEEGQEYLPVSVFYGSISSDPESKPKIKMHEAEGRYRPLTDGPKPPMTLERIDKYSIVLTSPDRIFSYEMNFGGKE